MRSLASLGLVVAAVLLTGAARSNEGDCPAAFGPEAARQVFDRLRERPGGDGCSLSDLEAEPIRITVRWTKQGESMPEATIGPAGCVSDATVAGDVLALTSPPALSAACPDALSAMSEAVRTLHPPGAKLGPGPVSPSGAVYSRRAAVASWLGVALALLGTMVIVARSLRRGRPDT